MANITEKVESLRIELRRLNIPEGNPVFGAINEIELQASRDYYEARTDLLTGLGNERSLNELLEKLEPEREGIGIIALDIKGLKRVNDFYSRNYGDCLIMAASQHIKQSIRHEDIFRAGNKADEFYIVSGNMTDETQLSMLKRLIDSRCLECIEIRNDFGTVRMPLVFAHGSSVNNGLTSLYETKLEAERKLNESKRELKSRII
ncbi:MAG: diguanylate cyclase [Nanoarchaeota archaeon]